MKPLSNSKIILMNNFGNLYALNCLNPFDEDFFVSFKLDFDVKFFDIYFPFFDQQNSGSIGILNSKNQIIILDSLSNLFQKHQFEVNFKEIFLFSKKIEKIFFLEKNCLLLNFKEKNEILKFKKKE